MKSRKIYLFEAVFANPNDYCIEWTNYTLYLLASNFGEAAEKAENILKQLDQKRMHKRRISSAISRSGTRVDLTGATNPIFKDYILVEIKRVPGDVVL